MSSRASLKKTDVRKASLKPNSTDAYSMEKHIITELRKEILRLQKTYARMLVKKDSEIARLKATLAEEKKRKLKLVISAEDAKVL